MSVAKRMKHEKADRAKRRRSKVKTEVSWKDVDPNVIVGFIELVERHDGAIRFGRSRDRAVYSIGFYIGDERFTEWIPGGSDLTMAFANLWDEVSEDFALAPPDDREPLEG